MATNAEQSNNPVAVIRQNLTAMAPEFKAALPSHISEEKFRRVAMTAIQNAPELQEADRHSLFGAIVRLAQDGLLPDGREAALVIFNTKNRSGGWEKKVQAMPMIAGILKKLRQSGEVAKVSAQVVCENDEFVWTLGFDEDVTHCPPALDKPRGRIIGAYATAVLKDGSRLLEVMSLEEIEKVRNVSRAKDKGPWVDWFAEMARKTVMRRLSKRLPMSTDLEEQLFARDETLAANFAPRSEPIELRANEPPVSRLDAIEQQIGGDTYDEMTGEIIDAPAATSAAPEPQLPEGMEPEPQQAGDAADAPHPAQARAEEIIAEVAKAPNLIDLNSLRARVLQDVRAMPDNIMADVFEAFDAADARVRGVK